MGKSRHITGVDTLLYITGATDLLHAVTYGTRPDPDAAVKARIRELERELAALHAQAGRYRCDGCGAFVAPDPITPQGRGHQVPNADGSPGYCGPVLRELAELRAKAEKAATHGA